MAAIWPWAVRKRPGSFRNPSQSTISNCASSADKEDAVLVAVTRDGKAYLGSTQIKPKDLPQKIKDMLSNKLDKTCYLKADQRARYEKVVDVVNNMRAGGVDQLGLLTEQIQEKVLTPAEAAAAKRAQQ